jgi:hypothetical protein
MSQGSDIQIPVMQVLLRTAARLHTQTSLRSVKVASVAGIASVCFCVFLSDCHWSVAARSKKHIDCGLEFCSLI